MLYSSAAKAAGLVTGFMAVSSKALWMESDLERVGEAAGVDGSRAEVVSVSSAWVSDEASCCFVSCSSSLPGVAGASARG